MPNPTKKESKDEYISRFMESEEAKKDYPDEKQRLAVAHSKWKEIGKKSRSCIIYGLELKEESDATISKGYVATTHLDSGFYDESKGAWVRDKINLATLEKWAVDINNGLPSANKASVYHDRTKNAVGVGIKGTAEVHKLVDGEYGLWVETLVDKTNDDYPDIKYKLDNNLLDSYSIEFITRDSSTGEYLDGAVSEAQDGQGYIRELLPATQLQGWTFTDRPMNEHAIAVKEATRLPNHIEHKEETKMGKETETPVPPQSEEQPSVPEEKSGLTDAERKELDAFRAKDLEQKEEKKMTSLRENIITEVKEMIKDVKVETKSKINDSKDKEDVAPEVREYKEMMANPQNYSVGDQVKVAARLAEFKGLLNDDIKTKTNVFERKNSDMKIRMEQKDGQTFRSFVEYKGLGITTNQNTDTDYLLSSAELEDIFDPIVYNILNQATVTWNILQKDDYSMKGNNQVQFKLKIAENSTAGAYTGNNVSLGNVTRQKYQTKFKKYAVGIEVDGDMIAAARPSDVFAQEVMDSTEDLLDVMNAALFAEVGAETAAGVIGFEYVADQAGNTTLYNVTRSQANGLASTTTTDNYINVSSADITPSILRQMKRKAVGTEGANIQNLVFITSHIQGDKFRGIYDAIQRTVPTSSRFGFTGRPEFDGIPIFEDKDCNDDDWFLVDLETHRIAIWVPPRLEMLGKDSDSEKGFVKTYWCTYNRAPRRMVMAYGAATS